MNNAIAVRRQTTKGRLEEKLKIKAAHTRASLAHAAHTSVGGNLRHRVRINSRDSALLHLSPATFVKRYPFDIALHAT